MGVEEALMGNVVFLIWYKRKNYLKKATLFNCIIFFLPYIFKFKLNATKLQISMVGTHSIAEFHDTSHAFIK